MEAARPSRVVYLSTIGAQAAESNLLTQHTIIEQALGDLPMPVTFLRPGWFTENSLWDIASARERGVISSFLQPLDKPVPMAATARYRPRRRRPAAGDVERTAGDFGGRRDGISHGGKRRWRAPARSRACRSRQESVESFR
ncbi:MAG: hypothetical protein WDN28_13640 [Chthoniobacter sp.]